MSWLDFREPVSAWTHGLWLILSLPGTLWLLIKSRGDPVKRLGFLVFGLTLVCCYGGSMLYHGVRLPARQIEMFRVFDHIGIFLLIAGTITPVALVVLEGPWRWGTLAVTWALAAAGIALRLIDVDLPRGVSTGLYLGMGWGSLLCYFMLARALSHLAMRLALLGGVLYSVGAVFNLLDWPVFWPGVFGAHELFHLFVMGGSLAHYGFMLHVVAPYDRQAATALVVGNAADGLGPATVL